MPSTWPSAGPPEGRGSGDAPGPAMILVRIVDGVAWGLRLLGAAALVFMAVSVFYDTTMRYFFRAPTTWSLEVNSLLVVFLALIPAASVLRERRHLNIGLVQERLGPKGRLAVATVIDLIGAGFCWVLTWRGFLIAREAFVYDERMSTTLGTPMFLPYALIPIGFGMLGLAFLANLLEQALDRGPPPQAPGAGS